MARHVHLGIKRLFKWKPIYTLVMVVVAALVLLLLGGQGTKSREKGRGSKIPMPKLRQPGEMFGKQVKSKYRTHVLKDDGEIDGQDDLGLKESFQHLYEKVMKSDLETEN